MFGAGLPGFGRPGGAPNLDGMMQAMQNPAMQQVMQQLVAQPGFMEARPSWRCGVLMIVAASELCCCTGSNRCHLH